MPARSDIPPLVNLLPWREQFWQKRCQCWSLSICAGLLLLLLLSVLWLWLQSHRLHQQQLQNTALLQANQLIQGKIQKISARIQPKENAFNLWNDLQGKANILPRTAQYLAWLATERPEEVSFQTLSQEKRQHLSEEKWLFRLNGTAQQQKNLDVLINSLEAKGMLINMTHLQRHNESLAFTIEIYID